MIITEKREKEYIYLQPIGELDAHSSLDMDEKMSALLTEGFSDFYIDCSQLNYISSAGLGVFISYLDDIKQKSGRLIFGGMRENVRDVFELLGLDNLVTIVNHEQDARKLFQTVK